MFPRVIIHTLEKVTRGRVRLFEYTDLKYREYRVKRSLRNRIYVARSIQEENEEKKKKRMQSVNLS